MTPEPGFQQLRSQMCYPARGEVPFWLACLHARRGEDEAAPAALRGGLDRGLWWPEDWLLEDGDLAVLRGSPHHDGVAAPLRPPYPPGKARERRTRRDHD